MADLGMALPYVLKHEGGWSDDPDDPGGATNFGVTLKAASVVGITTKEELHRITPEQVQRVYREYWAFDRVSDQRVATKLLDMAVNMGLRVAVKLAQESLNGMGASLCVDGLMGAHTAACINAVTPDHMLTLLCQASQGRYLDIVAARPKSKKFLAGWLKRAAEVPCA